MGIDELQAKIRKLKNPSIVALCPELSLLPPYLLAQARAAYADGMTVDTPACTQLALLGDRAVMDFGGEFALYPADGVLNLQNISGAALDSDVYLCYKNYRDGLFWGGIAYRAAFSGGFAADETRQSLQSHYTVDGSVILYMLYEAA